MVDTDRVVTLKDLAEAKGLCVSVVCPLDHLAPGSPHDEQLLAELRKDAARALEADGRERGSAELVLRHLDDALASVDREHPSRGVAVFAGSDLAHVVPLDVEVEPRAVVGDRFAIAELATDTARAVRARVLVLSLAKTRCVDVTRGVAHECQDAGFPIEIEAPTREETPHRDFALDEQEHAEAVRFVFRAVDAAVRKVHEADPRPLVLLGAERDLSYWNEVSTSRAPVIGRVHGNYEWAGTAEVANLAAPALGLHQRSLEQDAVDQIREKLTSGAVCGIADVWASARAGRGHHLVVEVGYHFRARINDDHVVPATPQTRDTFDAVDDAIREQVCHAGEVTAVGNGLLADCGRVAMVLRY